MKRVRSTKTILLAVALTGGSYAHGQVFSNKEVGEKNAALSDSLKASDYPYTLPIWGDKATKAGYSLPYSAGVSTQYMWSESDILINNLMVGFNGGTMYPLDEVVRFDKAIASVNGVSVRPDIWLFPFLNVYAILGYNSASTDVGWGLWLPDSTGTERQVFRMDNKVEFNSTTFGLGLTPTIGVGGGFLALDMNFSWSDIPQLDKPAFAFVFGPRVGKSFKLKNPESNLSAWVGGFRLAINSGTTGSLPIGEALPIAEWEARIDDGYTNVAEVDLQVQTWWNSLTPLEQANPLNVARYNAANSAIGTASAFLEGADRAVSTASTSTVEYSIDKRPKDMWNFLVGAQFQVNKHWMLRAEYGFLTSREQFMTGLQYRFGL